MGNPPVGLGPGRTFDVRFRVVNRKRSRSPRTVLTARLAPESGRRIMLPGRKTVRPLRPRRKASGRHRVATPSLPAGTYRLIACLKRRGVKAVCRTAARLTRVAGGDGAPAPADSPVPGPGPAPGPDPSPSAGGGTSTPPPPSPADPVVLAAGDVARCDVEEDEATARLLDAHGGDVVAVLGDAVDDWGTADDFRCYDETWGRHKARTRPAVGNHEYWTADAAPYYDYFGAAAGQRTKGYYSYDVGSWHVVVLNSNCDQVRCDADSAQAEWLRADLAAHPRACTLAYMHHPLYSSSWAPRQPVQPLWNILDAGGVDLVLTGHAHTYERFARQDPDGNLSATGVRQIVVGTGGHGLHLPWNDPVERHSEVRQAHTHGVLKLTLRSGAFDWDFLPVAGKSWTDSGSDSCV